MRRSKHLTLFTLALLFTAGTACKTTHGGGNSNSGSGGTSPDDPSLAANPGAPGATVSGAAPSGSNVMAVTVNGSQCGSQQYPNEPCVSVTICVPGTTSCQTISNLLLDTGSSGLRVFSSILTIALPQVSTSSGTLAECTSYGDGSSEWGPVAYADIKMGGETAPRVPVELINSTFGSPQGSCSPTGGSTPDTSPATTGFNGILGVGLFNQDCGQACTVDTSMGSYFACSGASCSAITTQIQVQNPVALLPVDNNGIILSLPAVPTGGAGSANGTITFGVGTKANNKPANVTAYPAAADGSFQTQFATFGTLSSFIDSGSNQLFMPQISSLPICTDTPLAFCPTTPQNLTATNMGSGGTPSGSVNFQIANFDTMIGSSNAVFANMGSTPGSILANNFDWGLPFFFGRTVVVGLEGTTSSVGSGKYWAY